jgi:hypothetical protein
MHSTQSELMPIYDPYTTTAVIAAMQQYQADHCQAGTYGYLNIEHIQADAGSQFTADVFREHCRQSGIHLVLAAPMKQYQNHLAKCTRQIVSTMGRSLLVHAQLPDTFMYHAVVYATYIFNVPPVRGLLDSQEIPATPYQLFYGSLPSPTSEFFVVPQLYATGFPLAKQMEIRWNGASVVFP